MSLIDIARDTLKEIPMADVLRERLSLAIDRLAEAEAKIEILQSENAVLKSQLEIERVHHQKCQQELERLRKEHEEEVRILHAVEFRRGKRTGNQWVAFCPRCHMPASLQFTYPHCSTRDCSMASDVESREIPNIIAQL